MSDDDIDYAQIAADQEFAKAFNADEIELTYDDSPEAAAEAERRLPPPGAPVTTLRTVRLPWELDQAVQELAARRDTTPSALIRDWVIAALEDDASLDPATELRRSLQSATRLAEQILSSDRHRDAA